MKLVLVTWLGIHLALGLAFFAFSYQHLGLQPFCHTIVINLQVFAMEIAAGVW